MTTMPPVSIATVFEQLRNINERLAEILNHLEKLNGSVNRHEQWIAAREQICASSCGDMDGLRRELQAHQSFIDQQKGGIKVAHFVANIIGTLLGAAAVLLGHYIEKFW